MEEVVEFLRRISASPAFRELAVCRVTSVPESPTYQFVVLHGMLAGGKKVLLHQGRKRFGAPDARAIAFIEAITDLGRLERLGERLLNVSSWQEFLSPLPS